MSVSSESNLARLMYRQLYALYYYDLNRATYRERYNPHRWRNTDDLAHLMYRQLYGLYHYDLNRAAYRERYNLHRTDVLEYAKQWRAANKEHLTRYWREYRTQNADRDKVSSKIRQQKPNAVQRRKTYYRLPHVQARYQSTKDTGSYAASLLKRKFPHAVITDEMADVKLICLKLKRATRRPRQSKSPSNPKRK